MLSCPMKLVPRGRELQRLIVGGQRFLLAALSGQHISDRLERIGPMGASFVSCGELGKSRGPFLMFEECNPPGVIARWEIGSVCDRLFIGRLRLIPTTPRRQDVSSESQAIERLLRGPKDLVRLFRPARGFLHDR